MHDFLIDGGYEVVCGEYLAGSADDEELAFALARDLAAGFPHSALIGAVADDADRVIYPRPDLRFDA